MTDEEKREYLKMNLIKPLEVFQEFGEDITTENFANIIDFEMNAVTELNEMPSSAIFDDKSENGTPFDNLIEIKKNNRTFSLKFDQNIDMNQDIKYNKIGNLIKLEELLETSVKFCFNLD